MSKNVSNFLDKLALTLSSNSLSSLLNQNTKVGRAIASNAPKSVRLKKHVNKFKPYKSVRGYRRSWRPPNESKDDAEEIQNKSFKFKSYKQTEKSCPLYRSLYSYKRPYYSKVKFVDKKCGNSFLYFHDSKEVAQFTRRVTAFRSLKKSKDKIVWPPLYSYKGIERKPASPRPPVVKKLFLKISKKHYPPEVLQPLYATKTKSAYDEPIKVNETIKEIKVDKIKETIKEKPAEVFMETANEEEVNSLKMKIQLHKQSNASLDMINRMKYHLRKIENMPKLMQQYSKAVLDKELEALKSAAPSKYSAFIREEQFCPKLANLSLEAVELKPDLRPLYRHKEEAIQTANEESKKVELMMQTIGFEDKKELLNTAQKFSRPPESHKILRKSGSNLITSPPIRTFATDSKFESSEPGALMVVDKRLDNKLTHMDEANLDEDMLEKLCDTNLTSKRVTKYMEEKNKILHEARMKATEKLRETTRQKIRKRECHSMSRFFNRFKSSTRPPSHTSHKDRQKVLTNRLSELRTQLKSYKDNASSEIRSSRGNSKPPQPPSVNDEPQLQAVATHQDTTTKDGILNTQGSPFLTTHRSYTTRSFYSKEEESLFKKRTSYRPLYNYKRPGKDAINEKLSSKIFGNVITSRVSALDRLKKKKSALYDALLNEYQNQNKVSKVPPDPDQSPIAKTAIPTTSANTHPINFPNKNVPVSKARRNVMSLRKLIQEKLGRAPPIVEKPSTEIPVAIAVIKKLVEKQEEIAKEAPVQEKPDTNPRMTSPNLVDKDDIINKVIQAKSRPKEIEITQAKVVPQVGKKAPLTIQRKTIVKDIFQSETPLMVKKENIESWKELIRKSVFAHDPLKMSEEQEVKSVDKNRSQEKENRQGNEQEQPPPHPSTKELIKVSQKLDSLKTSEKDCFKQKHEAFTKNMIANEVMFRSKNVPEEPKQPTQKESPKAKQAESRVDSNVSRGSILPIEDKLIKEIRSEVHKACQKSIQEIKSEVLRVCESLSSKVKKEDPSNNKKEAEKKCREKTKPLTIPDETSQCSNQCKNNSKSTKTEPCLNAMLEELYDLSKKEIENLSSRSLDRIGHKKYLDKFDTIVNKITEKINQKKGHPDCAFPTNKNIIDLRVKPPPPPPKKSAETQKHKFCNPNVVDCRNGEALKKHNIELEISSPSGGVTSLNVCKNKCGRKGHTLRARISLPQCVTEEPKDAASQVQIVHQKPCSDSKLKQKKETCKANEDNKKSEEDKSAGCANEAKIEPPVCVVKNGSKVETTTIHHVLQPSIDSSTISKDLDELVNGMMPESLQPNELCSKRKEIKKKSKDGPPKPMPKEVPPEISEMPPKDSSGGERKCDCTQSTLNEIFDSADRTVESSVQKQKIREKPSNRENTLPPKKDTKPISEKPVNEEYNLPPKLEREAERLYENKNGTAINEEPENIPCKKKRKADPGKVSATAVPCDDLNSFSTTPIDLAYSNLSSKISQNDRKNGQSKSDFVIIQNNLYHAQGPVLKCFIVPKSSNQENGMASLACESSQEPVKENNTDTNSQQNYSTSSREEPSVHRNIVYPRKVDGKETFGPATPARVIPTIYDVQRVKSQMINNRMKNLDVDSEDESDEFVDAQDNYTDVNFDEKIPVRDFVSTGKVKNMGPCFDHKSIQFLQKPNEKLCNKLKLPIAPTDYEKTWYTDSRHGSNPNYFNKMSGIFPK